MSSDKGFTLIELVCTVAIIGVIAAVAYPSFSSYMSSRSNLDLYVFSKQFLSDIREIRQMNINDPLRNYKIKYDKNSYSIWASAFDEMKHVNVPEGIVIKSSSVPLNEEDDDSDYNYYISFQSSGSTINACTFTISKGEFAYIITVLPATGRVTMKKGW